MITDVYSLTTNQQLSTPRAASLGGKPLLKTLGFSQHLLPVDELSDDVEVIEEGTELQQRADAALERFRAGKTKIIG